MFYLLHCIRVPPELKADPVTTVETMPVTTVETMSEGQSILVDQLAMSLGDDDKMYLHPDAKESDSGILKVTRRSDGYHVTVFHDWLKDDYPKYEANPARYYRGCIKVKSIRLIPKKAPRLSS